MTETMWQKFCCFGNAPPPWVVPSIHVMRVTSVIFGIITICLGNFVPLVPAVLSIITGSMYLRSIRGVR